MNILKFKNIDTDFHSQLQGIVNVPPMGSYVNASAFYTAYQPYDWDDAIYLAFDGPYQGYLKVEFGNSNINSIEDSNKLTNATIKAMTSKPGGGIVDVLSLQEYKDLDVTTISYSDLVSNYDVYAP